MKKAIIEISSLKLMCKIEKSAERIKIDNCKIFSFLFILFIYLKNNQYLQYNMLHKKVFFFNINSIQKINYILKY